MLNLNNKLLSPHSLCAHAGDRRSSSRFLTRLSFAAPAVAITQLEEVLNLSGSVAACVTAKTRVLHWQNPKKEQMRQILTASSSISGSISGSNLDELGRFFGAQNSLTGSDCTEDESFENC